MKGEEVRELEDACEAALKAGVAKLDIEVTRHTLHMMAKAAVAVLEAARKASRD